MGADISKYTLPHLWRDDEPDCNAGIKYDHQFGFSEERALKGPNATLLEMDSANLYPPNRDMCAKQWIRYHSCVRTNRPFLWRCKGFLHEVEECYIEERIHDMKEFEREKRLNARERRLREKDLA